MTDYTMRQIGGAGQPHGPGDAGTEVVALFQHDLDGVALAKDDTLTMPYDLGEGAVITDVLLYSTDNDTGSGIVYDVGMDSANDVIDGATIGQAGGSTRANLPAPLVLTGPERLTVTVETGPTSGTTSGTVSLAVRHIPPNGG